MLKTILCGSLFDGEHNELTNRVWLTIKDNLIESINTTKPVDPGDLIDHSQYTILPGFIDCHDHICLEPGDEVTQSKEPVAWLAIRGAARARLVIESGVTTW